MLLRKLEAMLHELYALEVGYAVSDFLITDPELARTLDSGGRQVDEKLLIAEADGEADVALYLEGELLDRLGRRDPLTKLDGDNLADFWAALEGVSHFTYYAWNAARDKHVSLFELELQAEVDKYVVCLLADGGASGATTSPRWRRRLFEEFELEPDLDADERDRYRAANDGARRYAASLERRFVTRGGTPDMLAELRRFYRLPLASKLDHIAKAA
jgi:hypothetical protein